MQNKTKSMFLLILMLVIGFILGALTSGALRHQRGERIARMSPEEQFQKVMEEIIQPTDEQRKEIERILKLQTDRIAAIQQKRSSEFFSAMDSTREAMDALLTPKQKEKLEAHMSKAHKEIEKRRVERLSRVLDLSSEQKEQLTVLFASRPEPGRMRKFPPGKPGNFDKMAEERKAFEEKVEALLNPEQVEKYRKFRDDRRDELNPPGMPRMDKGGFKPVPPMQ